MDNIKILQEWEVTINQEVEETTEETKDNQVVKITRKVKKELPVKMALRKLTRREAREAEIFYGKEFNRFFNMGFTTRPIMVNKLLNISGGIISEKEQLKISELVQKRIGAEQELKEAKDEESKKNAEVKLHAINSQLYQINTDNEAIFSQTAEAKAQNQLTTWLAFNLVMVNKNDKWTPYFEGDSFEKREEFMWDLEEKQDELYFKALEKISFYVGLYSKGIDTKEQFELIEKELKAKQEEEKVTKESPSVS